MHRIAATMTSHGELRSWGCSCIHNTSVLISISHVDSLNIPEEGSLYQSMDSCYGDPMVPHANSVFLSSPAAGSPVSWNAFSSCKPHYTSWYFLNRHFVLQQSTAVMEIIRFLVLKPAYCHLQWWTPQPHHTLSSSSGVMVSKLDCHKR
jgi:hypothetical protein